MPRVRSRGAAVLWPCQPQRLSSRLMVEAERCRLRAIARTLQRVSSLA